jgi:hypothetical protein
MRGVVVPLTYEELFFEGAAPIGHYIFTDFDRLSRYELECAAAFADALRAAAPEARMLNHPLKVLERYPLLVALHKAGINDFTATRLETGERPPRYPVFIRAEDGYAGPETELLGSDAEFDAAIEDLATRGLPWRGRIAIGLANQRSPDGYFHKYGAFNIAGRIVPHDMMFGEDWVVKVRFSDRTKGPDPGRAYGSSPEGIAEELRYIKANPHREVLLRAFAIAGIDYGRADYAVIDGRVQIFEINTNPHLPYRASPDGRTERLAIVENGLLDAVEAIDTPLQARGRVAFKSSRPRAHNLRWPRRRLPISLARKAIDGITARLPGAIKGK